MNDTTRCAATATITLFMFAVTMPADVQAAEEQSPGAAYDVQVAAVNVAGPYSTAATPTTRAEPVKADAPVITFTLDVDGSGAVTAQDGILIARYLLGRDMDGHGRMDDLTQGQTAGAAGTIEAIIRAGADVGDCNLDHIPGVDWADGVLLARYLLGITGDALTNGITTVSPAGIAAQIEAMRRDAARR